VVKYINFIVRSMTELRYFVPLVGEANERGMKSRFFIAPVAAKPNCTSKHRNQLNGALEEYNIEEYNISKINDYPDPTFVVEDVGLNYIDASKGHKIFSITYMDDFEVLYEKYVDKVDGVIFPSKYIAQHYDKVSDKNLYLGSPKYDVELSPEEICKKHNIPDLNNVLFVLPKYRDMESGAVSFEFLANIGLICKELGLRQLLKARRKDRIDIHPDWTEKVGPYMYFEDDSWFPHDTMELMKVSKLVVNFGSTTIKECTMLGVPVINLDIKPQVRHGIDFGKHRVGFSFLYDSEFCYNVPPAVNRQELISAFKRMISTDWSDSFSEARRKYLFEGNSSKRILDHIEGLNE